MAVTEPSAHLKVGLVSPYSWTSRWGVNRHIRGLAATLSQMGHEVSVIAPAEERDELRSARRKARAVRRAARKANGRPGGPDATAGTDATPDPFRLHKVAGTYRMPYSESLANLALPLEVTDNIDILLAEEQYDILHIHEPYPPSLSFTALRMARCPVVASFHTAGERFLSYQLLRTVVERFLSRLDGRICTSQNIRRTISGYFPGSYEVIGSGVDLDRFTPGLQAGGTPAVAWAAWSDPRKSLALLVRTMRLVPDDVPPFELSIVAGEELLWRENLVVPRRLRGRVSFGGAVSEERIDSLYGRAQIMAAPYATSSQATAILEAMAAGTALLVPGEGGVKELVSEGDGGFLLDHPYSQSLATNLMDLLYNPGLRSALADSAVRKAQNNSWEKVGAGIEQAYHRAHGRRRPAASRQAIMPPEAPDRIFADLHVHTSYSHDCKTTPEELLAACRESGLQAIAVTDHNTIEGALEVAGLAPDDVKVIIGEEIKTDVGEVIGLYLKEEIEPGLALEETIARIKAQEGLVYVPHPFDPLHKTPAYDLLAKNAADIDIIEVYNPRITFSTFNEKARRLARKYNIPGGAGSDCHVVQGVGTAMLSLRDFNSPGELLHSLREADVLRSSKSPVYLHSLKFLKNNWNTAGSRR